MKYPCTVKAIADYDAGRATGEDVGRAFGKDTADRNNMANCVALVRPGPPTPSWSDQPWHVLGHPDEPWLRRLVREGSQ